MKFSAGRDIKLSVNAKIVGKDRDGNVVTLYTHVHRDGRVEARGQCPHSECVVKDVIDS